MKHLILFTTLLFSTLLNETYAQDVETYMAKADEARDDMDFDEAVVFYSKVIELEPNNIEALFNRGWCENFWNKSKGFDDFMKVLELNPLHEGALHALADYYSFQEEYELAESYKMKAIALNPNTPGNLLTLARNANADGEYQKALELCNQSIAVSDEGLDWLVVLERAEVYFKLDMYEESIRDFEKCFVDFSYGMYSCNNYEMCGDSYKALDKPNKACEYWGIAVRNDDPEYDPASDEVKRKLKESCQ